MKIKLVTQEDKSSDRAWFFCPGCQRLHAINPHRHEWNGDVDNPTINPSIGVTYKNTSGFDCHSWIIDGMIRFEADSLHDLKGQTVELPHLTDENLKYFE